MTFQRNQQAYTQGTGTTSTNANYIADRNPTTYDTNFSVGQFWQNTDNSSLWYLNSLSTSGGLLQAAWVNIESTLATISDTADTPVSPSSSLSNPPNNIQLINLDGTIDILSDAVNSRIIFSSNDTGDVQTLTPNSGTSPVSPIGGTINVVGSGSLTTVGTSGTITAQLTGLTNHNVLVGAGTDTITKVSPSTSGFVLTSNGASSDPSFQSVTASGAITTVTGNSGGAESPLAGNFNLLGDGSITTVGTANTETIQLTGLTNHAVLVGAGTSTITKVGPSSTAGQVLQSSGLSADPAFSTATYPSTTTVNQLLYSPSSNVVGQITDSANGVLISSNTNVPSWLTNGTTGQILTATTGSPPSWVANSAENAILTVTGNSGGAESPLANNFNILGTGSITTVGTANTETIQLTGLTNHSLLVGAGTPTITSLGVATNGQLPIGSTGADPVLANLSSSDASLTITNGAGSINLQVPAGGGLSLGAFGSSPNANGLSLTTGVLNMEPADGSFPGGVSTTTQTFSGAKTFTTSVSSGVAGSSIGGYLLSGNTSGTISILPQAAAGTFNFNLPTTAGSSGFLLTSAGGASSAMTWTDPATLSGVLTLTGTSGGAISPTAGNITFSGGTTGLTLDGAASTLTFGGTLALANGGTNASLTASNGGIFYSTATEGAILSGTATAGQIIRSGANAAPTWSTATYPATAGSSGNVLTSDGTNWNSAAPAASSISLTGDTGGALTGSAFTIKANTASQNSGSTVSISGSGTTLTLNVTDSGNNTIIGNGAGNATLTAIQSVCLGYQAGKALTSANNNVYAGFQAGLLNSSGSGGNVGIGRGALDAITTGSLNVCIGQQAGHNYTSSESSNILLGFQTSGTLGESNVLRIANGTGTGVGQLSTAYISGINGNTTANSALVTINTSTNQLGTTVTPVVTNITFGSGTALDTYVEGTWTPTVDGAVSGTTTYGIQQGYYTKIGNIVYVSALLTVVTATGTGNAIFSGLPFTVKNATNYAPRMIANVNSAAWLWPALTTNLFWQLTPNTTTSFITGTGSGVTSAVLQMTNGAATFTLNGFYMV